MSKVSRTQEIEDKPLGEKPKYYDAMSGNAYQLRFGTGVDINDSSLRIAATSIFNIESAGTIGVSGTGTATVTHNLGYTPIMFGTYEILTSDNTTGKFPVGQRGVIPEVRIFNNLAPAIQGTMNASFTTNNEIQTVIEFNSLNDGTWIGVAQCQVWFMREISV